MNLGRIEAKGPQNESEEVPNYSVISRHINLYEHLLCFLRLQRVYGFWQ